MGDPSDSQHPQTRLARALQLTEQGRVSEVVQLVRDDPSLTATTNYEGTGLLQIAAYFGRLELVRFLLQRGACVDATTMDGCTALCEACANDRYAVASLLLPHGARVNPPLIMTTPLHEAAAKGSVECCELLIRRGARLDSFDLFYGTPLHAAVKRSQFDVVKTLLKSGADVNAVKIHTSALHMACELGDEPIVLLLLCFGADPTRSDNNYRTPAQLLPPCASRRVRDQLNTPAHTPSSLLSWCRRTLTYSDTVINVLSIPESLKLYLKFHDLNSTAPSLLRQS